MLLVVSAPHRQIEDARQSISVRCGPRAEVEVGVGKQVGVEQRNLSAGHAHPGVEVVGIGYFDAVQYILYTER